MRNSIPCLAALAGAALAVLVGDVVLANGHQPDFVVQWASQHIANPYDTTALREVIGKFSALPKGRWPYPYPPTYLLLTRWFAPLPFNAAYLIWLALSGAALSVAGKHQAAPLSLLSPWVIFALMAGQTSVLLGALIFGAITTGSGVLLGIAACIKPQFIILPVIGLAFARRWRALAEMIVTGSAIALASLALSPDWNAPFSLWTDWFASIPQTAALSATVHPHLDLPSWPLKGVALTAGLWLIWAARNDPADERAIVATGVSLLVMPHSLWYNSAIMVPAGVAYAARARWTALPIVASLLLFPTSILIILATTWPQLGTLILGRANGEEGAHGAPAADVKEPGA